MSTQFYRAVIAALLLTFVMSVSAPALTGLVTTHSAPAAGPTLGCDTPECGTTGS